MQRTLAAFASLVMMASGVQAQGVWQWDFNSGDYSATAGGGELRPTGGSIQSGTEFGSTTEFGIGDIDGAAANVMKFPKADFFEGYGFPTDIGNLDSWTLILDIYYPADSANTNRGILDLAAVATTGVEFGVDAANTMWHLGRGSGNVVPEVWQRIAFVSDVADTPGGVEVGRIRKYVDGRLVGASGISDLEFNDGRVTIDSLSLLFSDDSDDAEPRTNTGFVSSIQLRGEALSNVQMRAVGLPSAEGIPVELPPVPSFIVEWMPRGDVAPLNTALGAVINQGDSTIAQGSIKVILDGTELTPEVTRSGDEFTVVARPDAPFGIGSKHEFVLEFMDGGAEPKSFTRSFTAALFYEDFEGLPLGENVNEGLPGAEVWTKTTPQGWVIDDTGVPGVGDDATDGVTEWAGWSFANKDWWVETAGDQDRSQFSRGVNTVAIADPDEWDDQGHDGGPPEGPWYETILTTPAIDLSGIDTDGLFLQFASSWRPEFDSNYRQSAEVTVSYDDGTPQQLLLWLSDGSSPNFKEAATNESVLLDLNPPAGSSSMVLNFRMFDAGNDWWWAIDNVTVNAGAKPPAFTLNPTSQSVSGGGTATFEVAATGADSYQWFKDDQPIDGATAAVLTIEDATATDAGDYFARAINSAGVDNSNVAKLEVVIREDLGGVAIYQENFDGLPLGSNIDEATPGDAVWTKTAPEGWSIDDSGVPGAGTDLGGVTEWAGWSFASRAWWAETAGDQRRTEFIRGQGAIAIADGDEWDDAEREPGNMATFMTTSSISLDGIEPGSVQLRFDSSWRPEVAQTGNVVATFDDGTEIEVVRFESPTDSEFYKDHAPNDTITASIDNPAGATSMTLTFGYFDAGNNWWWAIDNIIVTGEKPSVFFEDFEGLALGPNVDEGVAGTNVWTDELPAGWSIDETLPGLDDPDIGVREWEGWGFADRAWWAETAGDQRRTEFLRGTGTIAIADGDEWDDKGNPDDLGSMNTFLATPAIDISGEAAGSLILKFDSSWRPENDQTANVTVSYDGGDAIEVVRFDSDSNSANFKDHAPNDTIEVGLRNPAGASSMVLTFGYFDAFNNWWWAIDNIEVLVGNPPPAIEEQPESGIELIVGSPLNLSVAAIGEPLSYQWYFGAGDSRVAIEGATEARFSIPAVSLADSGTYTVDVSNSGGSVTSLEATVKVTVPLGPTLLFFEDFNGLTLGASVDETDPAGTDVWTKDAPAGWVINDEGVPGAGTDNDGVTEWAGWSFATVDWWNAVAGQSRGDFTKGTGAVAIADGDEWDDQPRAEGLMDTLLTTPVIPLGGVAADSVVLRFDSSWRQEDTQSAAVWVAFDGGDPVEILLWDSVPGADFKADNVNETIIIPVNNPEGANSMVLSFRYFEAGNDWWWAVDNIEVTGTFVLFGEDFEGLPLGPNVDEGVAGDNVWTDTLPDGWAIEEDLPGVDDDAIGVREWEGWAFADRAWWAETAGDQRRTEFTRGTGTIAIADGDEWDDKGNPDDLGAMNTLLSTPSISLAGIPAGAGMLVFDSSWRPEDTQAAAVTASFDGGEPVEILVFSSDSDSPDFKGDAPNETISVPLNNPDGAQSVVITFAYLEATNDWWWAIDNVQVISSALPGSVPPVLPPLPGGGGGITEYAVNADGTVTITYTGTLQGAASVDGPFTPVAGASSPFTVNPADANAQFYLAR